MMNNTQYLFQLLKDGTVFLWRKFRSLILWGLIFMVALTLETSTGWAATIWQEDSNDPGIDGNGDGTGGDDYVFTFTTAGAFSITFKFNSARSDMISSIMTSAAS